MGPQKLDRASGIIARMAAAAVSMMGRKRRTADSMMASPQGVTGGEVLVDLVHENDRVAHDHAGQRDEAQHRDEAETAPVPRAGTGSRR